MNPRLKVVALIPTLLVAILCLLGDESMVSFLKKVGGTYIFFSVMVVSFGVMWRAAAPHRVPVARESTTGSPAEPAQKEEKTEKAVANR